MDYVWCMINDDTFEYGDTNIKIYTTFEKAKKKFIDEAIRPLPLVEATLKAHEIGADFKLVDDDGNELNHKDYDPQTIVYHARTEGNIMVGITKIYRVFNDAEITELNCAKYPYRVVQVPLE